MIYDCLWCDPNTHALGLTHETYGPWEENSEDSHSLFVCLFANKISEMFQHICASLFMNSFWNTCNVKAEQTHFGSDSGVDRALVKPVRWSHKPGTVLQLQLDIQPNSLEGNRYNNLIGIGVSCLPFTSMDPGLNPISDLVKPRSHVGWVFSPNLFCGFH